MAEVRAPHVLIFPFPAQGHVNSMLKLAELLALARFHVTFLLSHDVHDRLLRHTNIQSGFRKYPGFHLESLPNETYEGQIDSGDKICRRWDSLKSTALPFLKELLVAPSRPNERTPITSMIVDGVLSFTLDLGAEVGIPVFYYRPISPCSFWTYFNIPQLIESGDLPFTGDDMDVAVRNVRGMEQILRRRDLPSFCHAYDLSKPDFKLLCHEGQQTPRARGLILNAFEELDGNIISQVQSSCPNVYAIGPVHALLKARLPPGTNPESTSSGLWREDRSCMTWLDQQPSKSVLYVSFGSITTLTRDQLLEVWHGLVNSGTRFLWVIRPDLVAGEGERNPPEELEAATKARGYVAEWAPQAEVLGHAAVGGFLTHSGWNSTLESVAAGVPMLCWPFFADQQINSRFVEKVWKLGLDMKDTCDRIIVENMVRDLMEVRKNEFTQNAEEMSKLARKAVKEGGTSLCDLDRLIHDISLMSKDSS